MTEYDEASRFSIEKARPFRQNGGLAVATVRAHEDAHSGIFYFDQDDEPKVLHLAFHHRLECTADWTSWMGAIWAEPPIPKERVDAIGALCDLIARMHTNKGLAYALRFVNSSFDTRTGALNLGPGCSGLTCSTFVMAVFKSGAVQLLQEEQWQLREGDKGRQQSLVDMLARFGASTEHVDRVKGEIGCVRFRPTDVGGAAGGVALPVGFEEATQLGEILWSMLLKESE